MTDGPDVKQLEGNLAASAGPGPGGQPVHDRDGAAIRRWQAVGTARRRRTGALPLGAVVFAPVPLRIARTGRGGRRSDPRPVLAATSTSRVVTAQLTTDRQRLVHTGDKVRVSLSGAGAAVAGTVLRVGRVAATPQTDQGGTDDRRPATVTVTVRADLPAGGPDLDQAPAQLAITTDPPERAAGAGGGAAARPGDGYQVRLASGEHVRVRPGLFDSTNGTVEVTGKLTVGQSVQVPAP